MEKTQDSKPHNRVRIYALIFLALAAITLVELLLSSPNVVVARNLLNPLFVFFSLGKVALVAAFYMHLRSDNRFYTFIFLLPVVLLIVFALMVIIR